MREYDAYGYEVYGCGVYGYDVYGDDVYGHGVYGYDMYVDDVYGYGVYGYAVCRCDAYGSPELGSVLAPEALRFSSYLITNWSFSRGSYGLGAERTHLLYNLLYNTKNGLTFLDQ